MRMLNIIKTYLQGSLRDEVFIGFTFIETRIWNFIIQL